MSVFVRNEFNYDMYQASSESAIDCGRLRDDDNPVTSLAKQSFAEECDINTIVKRFRLTGELPSNVRMPEYADFTAIEDFHSALNAISSAREAFEMMPADVRSRFNNDPGAFVDFCMDDRNMEEAKRMGLVKASELAAAAAGVPGATAEPAAAVAAPVKS